MRKLAHWLEEHSPSESVDFYRELAISHAWEGGAIGAKLAELIQQQKFRELCEFELDYEVDGLTAHAVMHCRQALAFFQKLPDLEIGIDKEERAMSKFIEAEELCGQTNTILRKVRRGDFSFSPRVSSVIHAATRKIARILGDVPSLGELDLHFGPGATRATKRKDASIRRKLAERLQCSEELSPLVPFLMEELPHLTDIHSALTRTDEDGEEWDLLTVEIMPSKLSFVPKSAKTFRSICTEPGLNTLVQLGYGQYMARRLAAFGIDIRDQTVNQNRALEGSLTGALATLDLSSASDTISKEVVYELLPLDWATALGRARSGKVLLPNGQVRDQEKFSSMGNGFTFPLETLIFWSLAAACCPQDSDATAYGDDLIVPTECYPLLVEVLVALGFVVNLTKSYHTGPFRESCGKDYFRGTDVRPYYPKGWLTAQSLFVLHNWYVRKGDTVRAERVLNRINPALVLWGPDGYGDGHLLGDHPRRRPSRYTDRGFCGYFFDTYVTRSTKDLISLSRGEYVVPLYSIYRRSADKWEFDNSKYRDQQPRKRLWDPGYFAAAVKSVVDGVLSAPEGQSEVREPFTVLDAVLFGRNAQGDYRMDHAHAFWLKYDRNAHGPRGAAPLALGFAEDGGKAIPLPGVAGYKKISVYTLRD